VIYCYGIFMGILKALTDCKALVHYTKTRKPTVSRLLPYQNGKCRVSATRSESPTRQALSTSSIEKRVYNRLVMVAGELQDCPQQLQRSHPFV